MEVVETQENGAWILTPCGRIDTVTSKPFEERLMARVGAGPAPIVVDFSELDYISSAGLRVLLMGAKRQKAAGARFALCSVKEHIQEVLEIGGFTKILDIYRDRSAALRAFASA